MLLDLGEIAYALSLFGRCFPPKQFLRLFEEEGKNPAMISRAFSLLCVYRVIESQQEPRLLSNNFSAEETIPAEKKKLIRLMAHRRLLSWVEQRKLTPCFRLLAILAELGGGENLDDELILKSIYADIVAGTVQQIEKAMDSGYFRDIFTAEKAAIIGYIYQTTGAMLTGGPDEIKAAFVNPLPDCSAFPALKAQVLVHQSCFLVGQRDIKPALEAIKEAIQLSQKKNNFCLAQSYRLFSLVNLSRRQAGETNDYLDFAMENAEKSGNCRELGISAYYAAVSQFLFGNISKAIRLARKSREQALAADDCGWADRAHFFEGRLSFEIGSYRESLEIFESLRKKPMERASPEKDRLLAAWVYRARVFFQNPLIPKPSDSGPDADLFEVEAAYLAGNFRKAAKLADALTNPHAEQSFLFTEQPDWHSGFSQCELLYFSRGEMWDRLICAYHSLALSQISAGEEAMSNIQRILRDEQLSEMDPWDAFYFFAWYRILEQSGSGQIDKNTAVSMAYKRLQRRASRIDEVETRRQFLFQPRWNGALSLAAREFRLI
jgi:hypothetical protein